MKRQDITGSLQRENSFENFRCWWSTKLQRVEGKKKDGKSPTIRGEFGGVALDLLDGANIWSIMSITSRTTLDTPRPFARVHARAEEHAKKVLLAEHVHRDWPVNTSNDEQRPESSMNHGIDLSTKPNCSLEIFSKFDVPESRASLKKLVLPFSLIELISKR